MIDDSKPFLIGETAFHHEGDINFLKELIDAASEIDLNAIKFHLLFDLDDYFISEHQAYEALKSMIISSEDWNRIHSYTLSKNLKPIYLCNDVKSLKWVNSLPKTDTLAIELHATGLNDLFLLQEASLYPNTVILGTGGSTLDEIEFAMNYLNDKDKTDIFFMHGFQNYPTKYQDIKLDRMNKLKDLFGLSLGYADHTDPLNENNELISCLGVANGFNVIEKHFTTRFGEKRIDAQAAVSMDQFKKIKDLSEVIFLAMGAKGSLKMTKGELEYGNTGPMKKALVASRDISPGSQISLEDISYKRTNNSSPLIQKEISKLLGGKASRAIKKDEILSYENIEYEFQLPDFSQFNMK